MVKPMGPGPVGVAWMLPMDNEVEEPVAIAWVTDPAADPAGCCDCASARGKRARARAATMVTVRIGDVGLGKVVEVVKGSDAPYGFKG